MSIALHPLLDIAQQTVVNDRRFSFFVTLTVEGLVVQGQLISELEYRSLIFHVPQFDPYNLARKMREESKELQYGNSDSIEKVLQGFRDAASGELTDFEQTPVGETQSYDFIHLENVSLLTPHQITPLDYWRTPLDSIGSIHLSQIQARPPFPTRMEWR